MTVPPKLSSTAKSELAAQPTFPSKLPQVPHRNRCMLNCRCICHLSPKSRLQRHWVIYVLLSESIGEHCWPASGQQCRGRVPKLADKPLHHRERCGCPRTPHHLFRQRSLSSSQAFTKSLTLGRTSASRCPAFSFTRYASKV